MNCRSLTAHESQKQHGPEQVLPHRLLPQGTPSTSPESSFAEQAKTAFWNQLSACASGSLESSGGAARQGVQLKSSEITHWSAVLRLAAAKLATRRWDDPSWLGPMAPFFAQGNITHLITPSNTHPAACTNSGSKQPVASYLDEAGHSSK